MLGTLLTLGSSVQVAIIGSDRKFRVLTPSEVEDYLREVQ
jgi:hypothetical protein